MLSKSPYWRNVSINSALGDDDIRIDGLIQGSVIIDSGKGNDRVSVSGRIGVPLDSMGNLRDGYVFGTMQTGFLGINTGAQKDKVSLTSLDVDGRIFISTGSHDDDVQTDLVRSIFIDLQTDQGDDKVNISRTKAFQISASLGAGSDLLRTDLATLSSVPMFFMNGGTGVDTLDRNGNVGGIAVGVFRSSQLYLLADAWTQIPKSRAEHNAFGLRKGKFERSRKQLDTCY